MNLRQKHFFLNVLNATNKVTCKWKTIAGEFFLIIIYKVATLIYNSKSHLKDMDMDGTYGTPCLNC